MKICILSRSGSYYATRRLREACRARGHEPWVIDPIRCLLEHAGKGPRIRYGRREVRGIGVVLPRIGTSGIDYALHVVRQFEAAGVPVVNSSPAIALAKSKWASLQCLARHGFAVPRTVLMRYPPNIDRALSAIGGTPAILKFLRGTQGIGVILVETRSAIESLLDTFWTLGEELLMQEYVAEASGRDVRVLVVGDEAVAAMRRQAAPGDFRANIHRGGLGERIDLDARTRRLAVRAARAAGLTLAGVDFLETKRGPVFLELNASPGFEGLEAATGKDIADRIVRHAIRLARAAR